MKKIGVYPSNPCASVFHHPAVDCFTNQRNQIKNTYPYLSIDCGSLYPLLFASGMLSEQICRSCTAPGF